MLRVVACVTQQHEPWLLVLSVLVCLSGAFTFMRLLRGALLADNTARRRWVWIGAVAGGGTIWSTHFIDMLAHRSIIPISFDIVLTCASVVAAIGFTWLGLVIVVGGGQGSRWAPLAGGGIVGLGVGAMHYLGMLALAVPGALDFDAAYVAVSVAIGCSFSGAAVWAAARRDNSRHSAAAVVLFALAIAGHHFTSLTGTTVVLDGRAVGGWAPHGDWLPITVAVVAVAILGACAGVSVIEQNLCLRIAAEAHLRALSVQSVRFEAALDNMTQGLCLFDSQGRLIMHNRRFATMFGTPLVGATPPACQMDASQDDMFRTPEVVPADGRDNFSRELADGRVIRVSRQVMADGGWVATYEDVTERRRARDQLSHMARHDGLTGLPNRMKLRGEMERMLLRAEAFAVHVLDLDGFKGVNDTCGHAVGDELLRAVAGRLRDCTRETDLVARLGGDEFVFIQVGAREAEDAAALSTRLLTALSAPFELQGHHIVTGGSIGIALADQTTTADELLRSGDIALDRAKSEGRNTWRFFEPEMDAELKARHRMKRDLQESIINGQLEVLYQPQVDANTEALTGFEALLRWNHPQLGTIPPVEFIPMAEDTGLIDVIGAWVLQQACTDAVAWPDHLTIAVNLSPRQFLKGDLVREVERALAASGLPARRLELEITESVLLQDNEATLGILHRLRALGTRVSMDDFGTGYSSLSYLRCFPFDKIKIDRSFVRNIVTEKGSIEIIRAVVGLGHALGMEVLAEGVETNEQLRTLRIEGCNELQGYLFSRPRPLREVQGIIASYQNAKGGERADGSFGAIPRLERVGREEPGLT